MNRKRMLPAAFLLCWVLASVPGLTGQNQVKIAGLITLRSGEVMNVKTPDGKTVEVVLNPDTKIEEPAGAFGFRKKHLAVTALVPGLSVEVQGLQYENSQLVAGTVTFSQQSLQVANKAQAGPPATPHTPQSDQPAQPQDVQETSRRFSNLSDYDLKATYEAHFAPGSATLSQSDQAGILKLAQQAGRTSSYVIQVKGFADFVSNAPQSEQLSKDRAEAVIDYLEQTGRIPVMRIVAPGAMATSQPKVTTEAPQGAEENRRVEIKLLTPKKTDKE